MQEEDFGIVTKRVCERWRDKECIIKRYVLIEEREGDLQQVQASWGETDRH